MRVLLTGAHGQLGRELARSCPTGVELRAAGRGDLDLTDHKEVGAALDRWAPDVILNAAAYTAVDRAESEPDAAFAINARAVGRLATEAEARNQRLVHVSTDFVFDGRAEEPYGSAAETGPLSIYGRSKLEGEGQALGASPRVAVVRTSWLYSVLGRNFVTNMLRLMSEREALRVVADQVGSPTWAAGLAGTLWRLVERPEMTGLWHWCDGGSCSWFEFARVIQEEALSRGLLKTAIPIAPVETSEFPTPARRPAMSALDPTATYQALGIEPVPWRVALGRMLDEMIGDDPRG